MKAPIPAKSAEDVTQRPTRARSRRNTRDALLASMRQLVETGSKLSISAVAANAGVTPGLIHNTYPDVAEEIRAHSGRSSREQRDAKATELMAAKARLRDLRNQLRTSNEDLVKLASINETLRAQLESLNVSGHVNVVALRRFDRKED